MIRLAWKDQPPEPSPYVPILSPRGLAGRVEGIILSDMTRGILVHFRDARTTPCLGSELPCDGRASACPACLEGCPRRWKGYLGLQEARSGRVGLAELTPWAVAHAQVLVHMAAPGLRGRRLCLQRCGHRRNGHVMATVTEGVSRDDPTLPPAPDIDTILLRIWYSGRTEG